MERQKETSSLPPPRNCYPRTTTVRIRKCTIGCCENSPNLPLGTDARYLLSAPQQLPFMTTFAYTDMPTTIVAVLHAPGWGAGRKHGEKGNIRSTYEYLRGKPSSVSNPDYALARRNCYCVLDIFLMIARLELVNTSQNIYNVSSTVPWIVGIGGGPMPTPMLSRLLHDFQIFLIPRLELQL